MKCEGFQPSKCSKICSDHLTEKDFLIRTGFCNMRLKKDAVSSVFPKLPEYLQEFVSDAQKVNAAFYLLA